MTKLNTEEKRIVVIASSRDDLFRYLSEKIQKIFNGFQCFHARDGMEALFKMENTPPHILLTEVGLDKLSGLELCAKVINHPKLQETSVIILDAIPEREHFVDQVVTQQVQFLPDVRDDALVAACLSRSLNRLSEDAELKYRLHFLAPEDILFYEGDSAQCVYIVKKGQLEASKGKRVLGQVNAGEFVGEMAHLNGEPRSATVQALTACELIEIPINTLDMVLFSKPAWSKALVSTLSKRLKRTNDALTRSSND